MGSLSAGGPGWQVLKYLVGKLGEGFPPLPVRIWMNGDNQQTEQAQEQHKLLMSDTLLLEGPAKPFLLGATGIT